MDECAPKVDISNILVAIPLFEQRHDLPRLMSNESQRDAACADDSSQPLLSGTFRRRKVIAQHLGEGHRSRQNDPVHCAILLALELCQQGKYNDDVLKQKMEDYIDGSDPLGYCSEHLLGESFDLLQQATRTANEGPMIPATHHEWNDLIRRLSRHVMYLSCIHPYVNYANHVVPQLTKNELQRLSEALLVPPVVHHETRRRIPARVLDLQKALLDLAAQQTCYYAAILRDETFLLSPSECFSCFPSAQLEWPCGGKLVPLYADNNNNDNNNATKDYATTTFMPVLDDSQDTDGRDDAYQQRTGASCRCDRCRFELFGDQGISATTTGMVCSLVPLARHYMARGNLANAKRLYEAALAHHATPSATKLDILHALGAIELGLGNFMAAQRLWHEACGVDDDDDDVAHHAGLCLQRAKLDAYRYFPPATKSESSSVVAVHCPVEYPLPGVFVARVMDLKQCEKVIAWAEAEGQFTKGRHYAVPTNDIPVHTIPSLLSWFRDELFFNIINPLLVQEFGGERYYVHDAFFVKYEATVASNYLSIRKSSIDLV
jgi:tetratricopeptide (TPR) repeat protein